MGGEPAKELETRRQAGDRSRTHCVARHAGPAGGRHCERRRVTARGLGRDACTWAAGRHRAGAAGRCAGGGWHRGGGGPLADSLPSSARRPAGAEGRGKGSRWSVHGLGNFKLAGGLLARGHSAGSGRGQLGQQCCCGSPLAGRAAWRPESGRAG